MQAAERLQQIEFIVLSNPPKEVMQPWIGRNNKAVKYISKQTSMLEDAEKGKAVFKLGEKSS
nr:hypothetical protein [Flavobacterium sp. ASV13]